MKRILFIPIFFSLLLIGCEPAVTFNNPQPEGVDSLTVIPKKLVGYYVGNQGASSLIIDRKSIILSSDYELKMMKDSSDWDNMSSEEKSKYRLEGEYIIEHIVEMDTLFYFSEDYVLKKYKGYYFLSSRCDDHSWIVQKIKIQKGLLTIGKISVKEEFKTLKKINESPIDTTTYKIKFTKKQFHEYIDNDGFSKVDTFIRVKTQTPPKKPVLFLEH